MALNYTERINLRLILIFKKYLLTYFPFKTTTFSVCKRHLRKFAIPDENNFSKKCTKDEKFLLKNDSHRKCSINHQKKTHKQDKQGILRENYYSTTF